MAKKNFKTGEKYFHEDLYHPNVFGKKKEKDKIFPVPIGNAKVSYTNTFNPHAPEINYRQNGKNTCVISSLESSLFAANENVGEQYVASRIALYLSSGIDRIQFSIDI